MPQIEIRLLEGQELVEATHLLLAYAFEPSPPLWARDDFEAEILHRKDTTQLVLFEDGMPVATGASSLMRQNVRGMIYPAGGVWGVAAHPEARRKGYVRRLLHRLFEELRDGRTPLSCLYPFRESFYDRLGYTTFPAPRKARFSPLSLVPLLKKELGGSVRLLSMEEGADAYVEYARRHQRAVHGLGLFTADTAAWLRRRNSYWVALASAGKERIGVMLYQLKGEGGDMLVPRFYYSNSLGRYLLLEWIARHADQVKEIEMKLPPADLPETWLPDMNVSFGGYEPPMGRVIDLSRIGGMVVGEGGFAARIRDEHCPWNDGVYRFESQGGILKVTRSEEEHAECDLTIHALSALVYGTHDPDSFALRGWGSPSPQTAAGMRALFPPMLPYLHEVF
jgi:predicted acetyltransferase